MIHYANIIIFTALNVFIIMVEGNSFGHGVNFVVLAGSLFLSFEILGQDWWLEKFAGMAMAKMVLCTWRDL